MVRFKPDGMPESVQPVRSIQPTSPLAVIALVLALLPMCVPLTLLGMVLGMLAVRRIDAGGGQVRGRAAARGAIWVGLVMSVVGWWLWTQAVQWTDERMTSAMSESTATFLQDIQRGEHAAAMRWWSTDVPPPSQEEVAAFVTGLDRLGVVQQVGIASKQPVKGADMWSTRFSAWLKIVIDGTAYDGSARFDVVPIQTHFKTTIRQLKVTTPEGALMLWPGDTP